VFRNSDLRFFISFADFLSAGVIFLFFMLVLQEVASLGSFIIVTVFLSAGVTNAVMPASPTGELKGYTL